ncbi:cache domain-containing sensor histidine kinase [Paenibacillus alkalitolerans]|uniref:cache domain-containing sensor histidine kinase n=1 Tax=Paenibacillus alkalitolerans TaxID=2799335 RepID=UPI0018F4B9D7|nr:sensor histidine kinase [Paenibacillus alkalitolerans]
MAKKPSILVQLIVGFSGILIVVMSVTSFFSYHYSSQVVSEKATQYMLESVVQMRGKTDVLLREYDKFSQRVGFSPTLQQYLSEIKSGKSTVESPVTIDRYLSNKARYIGSELSVHVLDLHGGFYSGSNTIVMYWRKAEEIRHLNWYPQIENNRGRVLWVLGTAWRSGKIPAVIGARQINNWSSLDRLGDMFLVIPLEQLARTIEQRETTGDGTKSKTLIIDQLGQVVYSSNLQEIGTVVERDLLNQFTGKKAGVLEGEWYGKPAYMSYSVSDYSGWTAASYIEVSEVTRDLQKIQQSSFFIALFGLAAALLLIVFFSWSTARPIRYLSGMLAKVERGVLFSYRGTMMNREVASLYESFNSMILNLNKTIKDMSDLQISEKQAQLVALKAQFRPHFLYNTLNTIYWSLINEGQDRVAKMVLTLSDLLRYSVQPGSDMVTIEEDLHNLERFMFLQKERYKNKLQFDTYVEPELLKYKMMKMMLQPLAENAFTHGLEPVKNRQWILRVEITRAETGNIRLVVEDNGLGMPEDKMADVLNFRSGADEKNSVHTGLGLANLNHRIKLIYGREYGLKLSNSQIGGLRVEIVIPATTGGAQQ